jgi:hypothetical protein
VVKHDQFASALRVSLVSAEGTGRIQLGESALDRDPLSLLKPDPRAETRKVGGNASSVADEFEVSDPIMDRGNEIWRDSILTRRLESRAATSMATPKLDGVDFVSQEQSQNGLLALYLSSLVRRRPDAHRASRLDRVERTAD